MKQTRTQKTAHKHAAKKPKALPLAFCLSLADTLPVTACAPDYPVAVLVSYNHPELPLKLYASGNLGIIQSSWALSYLCVAYRYLAGKPLSPVEMSSANNLWLDRMQAESPYIFDENYVASINFNELRKKILHIKNDTDPYYLRGDDTIVISDSAYQHAFNTLTRLVKNHGQSSPIVLNWLQVQEQVFARNKERKVVLPPDLPTSAPIVERQDRLYQRAAASFYLKNVKDAEAYFEQLATDQSYSEQSLARYMLMRCRVDNALGSSDQKLTDHLVEEIKVTATRAQTQRLKTDTLALVGLLQASIFEPDKNFERLAAAVSLTENKKTRAELDQFFGLNLSDLTFILSDPESALSQTEKASVDLVDWLQTIHQGYDRFSSPSNLTTEQKQKLSADKIRRGNYALQKWQQKKTTPWLVAVMLCGGLAGPDRKGARAAAAAITPDNPAYLTAHFYLIDAMLSENKIVAAQKELNGISAQANPNTSKNKLPISSANLFQAQKIATAQNLQSYLSAACMGVAAASSNALLLPDPWPKSSNKFRYKSAPLAAWDVEVGRDIDYNLPYSAWLSLSRKKNITANLRARIVCATWLRSILLNNNQNADELIQAMIACYPSCRDKLSKYKTAVSTEDKNYLLAQIILDDYGFSPYVQPGLPRFAQPFSSFNYYQENYWQPLPEEALKKNSDEQSGFYDTVADRGNTDAAQQMVGYYKRTGVNQLMSGQPTQSSQSRACSYPR